MKKTTKKSLGQFFTTNVKYILSGMEEYVKDKRITDPFAGNSDLLDWAKSNGAKNYYGFDIDKNLLNENIKYNDSLVHISKSTFILTNPPYLAKNKMDKKQKEKYMLECDDFYLLAIKKIIESECVEGILIVPVNFLSAENSDKIRKEFLSIYKMVKINFFKNRVFEDTSYNVVAIYFVKDNLNVEVRKLKITSFPDNIENIYIVERKYNYKIAGRELYDIKNNSKSLKIKRLTEQMMNENKGKYNINIFLNDYKTEKSYKITKDFKDKLKSNIIILNCIDGKLENKICAEDIRNYGKDCLVGKSTSRNIAYILLENVSIENQKKLIKMFNDKLNNLRGKYNSLFLTNFRDNDRKRISFEFCYSLLNWCWDEI
jgi:hypothetical protein